MVVIITPDSFAVGLGNCLLVVKVHTRRGCMNSGVPTLDCNTRPSTGLFPENPRGCTRDGGVTFTFAQEVTVKFSELKLGRAFCVDSDTLKDSTWIKISKTQAIRVFPEDGYHQSCKFELNHPVVQTTLTYLIMKGILE